MVPAASLNVSILTSEAELNHLIILIIIIIFLQVTNCTKNLMTFVDLTDDWKVFIGRGDTANRRHGLWFPFLSSLIFPHVLLKPFLSCTAHLSFLPSRVTTPASPASSASETLYS